MMALLLLPLGAVEAGGYFSVWKAVFVLLVLLAWMKVLTWIDKDADAAFLPRQSINMGMMGGAALAFALVFVLPGFWICFLMLLVLMGAEIGVYLHLRNKKVGLKDLKESLRASFVPKKKGKDRGVVSGEVTLFGKTGGAVPPPDAEDDDAAGFMALQQLLLDPLTRGAERIDMAPADGAAQVRYQVDGVAYNATAIELAASQAGVTYMKELAGLDLEEKRKPQKGKMKAAVEGVRHDLEIQTAGSAAGEFVKIMVDPKKRTSFRLPDLGLDEGQMAKVKGIIDNPGGIVLVTAPKGQGLTSAMYGILRAHDAFLTHIHTLERAPDEDLEGITQNLLPANASPDEESQQLSWVLSQEPDMVAITLLESPVSAQEVCRFAQNGRRVYVGLRAGGTLQALELWRKLVGNDATAMRDLRMIISGRVMRRLCNACKVAYTPDPDTVRRLNLDPGKVSTLFMPRKEPVKDQKGNVVPCNFCKELRYKGRFGIFEIMEVDDDVKQIVTSGGTVNQLKAVFRKQRAKFLQEVALQRITEGETSVQEMLRVLRTEESGAAAKAEGARAPAAAAKRPAPAAGAKPPSRKSGA